MTSCGGNGARNGTSVARISGSSSRNTEEKTKAPEPYPISVEEFSVWQNQILRGAERYWSPQLTARPERRH